MLANAGAAAGTGTTMKQVGTHTLGDIEPLAVSFPVASQISGLGLTTLWKIAKEGRIRLIRPPSTRRTLIEYLSLKNLLASEISGVPRPLPHYQGRARKLPPLEATS
jgi:hypothetical protein